MPQSLSLLQNLAPTIDERAVNFFFSNHVLVAGGQSTEFIGNIQAAPQGKIGGNLLNSIKAVGLVGFSNAVNAPGLSLEAERQYVSAVRCINIALQSPSEVKKDNTLLAVMVLGIYEILANQSQESLVTWAAHVKGAAALLKIRGPEQLSTASGRRLFGQVTASLATSCLQQEVELPDHILELSMELENYIDHSDIVWIQHRQLLRFTNFFAKIRGGSITDMHQILDQCLEFDLDLIGTFYNVPKDWEYSTLYLAEASDLVYGGYYHVYQSAMTSMVWNGMRVTRILLHEIIRGVLLKAFSSKPPVFVGRRYTEQLQTSTEILYELSFAILASVPQHLEHTFSHSIVHENTFDSVPSSVPALKIAVYQLPWTLYTVGVSDTVTKPMLLWVIRTLRHIGHAIGVRQAAVLADRLERIQIPLLSDSE